MLLIDPRLDTPQIEAVIERFSGLVAERGGEVKGVERWGRRRLAYEIEDLEEGFYAVFTYHLPPQGRGEVEAALPFLEGLLRSKTVYPEARVRKVGP